MAIRYYLVPTIGDGTPRTNPYRPKYLDQIAGKWEASDYGKEPVMLVRAEVTDAEHTSLVANADVTAAPLNLGATIGGALATVQAKLEAFNIPADWVGSGMTYRTVLLWIARLFCLSQRLNGLSQERIFQLTENMDTVLSAIPDVRRQRLAAAAASLGLDTSGLTLSMTLRQALKYLGNQIQIDVRL